MSSVVKLSTLAFTSLDLTAKQQLNRWVLNCNFTSIYWTKFQEQQTGLDTGLIDFIRVNAPFAMDIPAAKYDEYYR